MIMLYKDYSNMNAFKVCTLILILIFLTSCSSMQHVSVTQLQSNIDRPLSIGDYVSIKTRSGQSFEFTITNITSDTLFGENIFVDISDINTIKRKEFSLTKSVGLTAGVWYGLAIVAMLCCFVGG